MGRAALTKSTQMISQLDRAISRLERDNRRLIDENEKLIQHNAELNLTVRRFSSIVDELYVLLCRYVSAEDAEGLTPLYQSMKDAAEEMKKTEDEDVG